MKLYQKLASLLQARKNCLLSNNVEWAEKHEENIINLVEKYMPCGSGFDNGTLFNFEKSNTDRLIFNSSFHYMDNNGYYIGWSDFTITATPSLQFGINVRIKSEGKVIKRFYYDKDYFMDVFADCLEKEVL